MTKEEILNYLHRNRELLNISQISRETGIKNLRNILTENKNSDGYTSSLQDRHLPELERIISKLRS